MPQGVPPELFVCFEALTVRALSHEYAHRRALVATAAPTATSTQLAALQKRLSEMLPAKLLDKHPGNALLHLELGAMAAAAEEPQRAAHSAALLRAALETTQWSAVPELGNETPLATFQSALGGFLNSCESLARALLVPNPQNLCRADHNADHNAWDRACPTRSRSMMCPAG